MKLKIREIILWPRRTELPPRRLKLDPNKVNVISGSSKTGKSAIIPIIDYCMASNRCAIPVEIIRDSCCWFGLLAETNEGQTLFARRGPEGHKSTGDMYMVEGHSVEIPNSTPIKNITADAVKTRLNELCGLSNLDFDYDKSGIGFSGRPSFRDLMAFTFQPQNVVANPDVLFFKADTYEHREKLKTIFPYVLKAIGPEILAAQHELRSVQRELARKDRELKTLQRVSERWLAELRASVVQARELGLIGQPIRDDATRHDLLDVLQRVVENRSETNLSADGISEAVTELVELEKEEAVIDTQLMNLRRRLAEMSKLKNNAERFKDALSIQRDRLAVSQWLKSLGDEARTCPVCDGPLAQHQRIGELLESLAQVEENAKRFGSASASLDREMLRVKEDLGVAVEKLQGIAVRTTEAGNRSGEAQQARFRQSEVARFVGRVERGLEIHQSLGQDSVLTEEVEALRRREEGLRRLISAENVEDRKRRSLDKISVLAGRLLPDLDTERPDDPIELSITDLTVKIKGRQRVDYLWEIGSGANWLSYHVAVSLALQQLFLDSESNPVPSFLVYDQPSQVYFPRRLAVAHTTGQGDNDPILEDEDVEAVRKVFATIAGVVQQSGGALQTLILDHAGPDVWAAVPGVHLVEEWRQGTKLVPLHWLS